MQSRRMWIGVAVVGVLGLLLLACGGVAALGVAVAVEPDLLDMAADAVGL